eukprot:scaffold703_cov133-Skeletonema_dohrnii-CCMP3373.AAC.5
MSTCSSKIKEVIMPVTETAQAQNYCYGVICKDRAHVVNLLAISLTFSWHGMQLRQIVQLFEKTLSRMTSVLKYEC